MNMTSDFKKVFAADPHLASVSIRWERGLENIAQTMIRCDECGGHGYVPQVTSREVRDPMVDVSQTVELASCDIRKMARVYHKQNFAEETTINAEFETVFTNIMS